MLLHDHHLSCVLVVLVAASAGLGLAGRQQGAVVLLKHAGLQLLFKHVATVCLAVRCVCVLAAARHCGLLSAGCCF
jgi:hypothetical protein